MPSTKHCGGKTCDQPCRGVSDCKLRAGSVREPREHYIPKIRKLLEAGPATLDTIAVTLELRKGVTASYLWHMHHELREIRKSSKLIGADLWELGEDLTLPSGEGERMVPAQQMGMSRGPLVAAMFGPGRGVVA